MTRVAQAFRPAWGIDIVRQRIITTLVFIAAVSLIAPAPSPSVEDVFVATTEAASEAEGAVCLMPEAASPTSQLVIPKSSNEGGDIPPVRMVVDPYPSFNGVVLD